MPPSSDKDRSESATATEGVEAGMVHLQLDMNFNSNAMKSV